MVDWCAVREARAPFQAFVAEHELTEEQLKNDVKVDLVRSEDGTEMMRVLAVL